jgi:hypothetical protein
VILAAGLLVLLGLGLFIAGLMTGGEVFYWGCVAACGTAGVLLFLVQRQTIARPGTAQKATTQKATTTSGDHPATGEAASAAGSTADSGSESTPVDAPAPPAGRSWPHVHGTHPPRELPDPPAEEVEVTDLLLVVDLTDEVLVLDEHPRYHLADCVHLRGRTPIPLRLDEARRDGFTPCAVCAPDRNLAEQVRARKASGNA